MWTELSPASVALSLGLSALLIGLQIGMLGRFLAWPLPGMGWWTLGGLSGALGLVAAPLQDVWPVPLGPVLGNALLWLGVLAIWRGLAQFLGRQPVRSRWFLLAGLGLGWLIWTGLAHAEQPIWRVAGFNVGLSALVGAIAVQAWRGAQLRPVQHAGLRAFAGVAFVVALMLALRSLGALLGWTSGRLSDPGGMNLLVALLGGLGLSGGMLTLVLLVSNHLHHRLRRLADTDELTGLLNRAGWRRRLDAQNADATLVYLLVDVDHFKAINDQLGHAQGDLALVRLARHLKALARLGGPDWHAVRLGGEEFLLAGLGDPGALAAHWAQGQSLGAQLLRRLERERSSPARVMVSGGLAHGPLARREAVFKAADSALYEAKRRGRGRIETADALPAPACEPPASRAGH